MKSKILKSLAILVLLIGCCSIILLQKKRSDLNSQTISKLNELDNKKYKLNRELEELESNYKEESYGKAGVSLLIAQSDNTVVSFIYPVLRKKGYHAVLALDLRHLPGDEDTITRDDFDMLMEEGWAYCIRWDGKTEFQEYMTELTKRFQEKDMDMPQTLYVNRGYYTEELKEEAKKYHFKNIIHHGEGEKSSIALYQQGMDCWEIGSIGYLDDLFASYLKTAAEKGGCMILTIGNDSGDELFNVNSMNNVLAKLQEYEQEDRIIVDTIGNVKNYKKELAKDQEKRNEDYQEQSHQVKNELEELEKEREDERHSIN